MTAEEKIEEITKKLQNRPQLKCGHEDLLTFRKLIFEIMEILDDK